MEIEAKFRVPDAATARVLRAQEHLGEFRLGAPKRFVVRDTFFDTRAKELESVRYVLRVRKRNDGKTFITLKTPTTTRGAIHKRPEYEFELVLARTPRLLSMNELPKQIAKKIAPITHSDLFPMFSISQTRTVRAVRNGRRVIAEWSLDFVKFSAGKSQRAFYELEIELKKRGTEQELHAIEKNLKTEFALQPQTESKFARAVEFMRKA